ncbi:MAG: isoprenylcysteine carboxylmethyltransferase family protein, partial [archaeon]
PPPPYPAITCCEQDGYIRRSYLESSGHSIEVTVSVSIHRTGLGAEHPYCDRVQILMILLFLVVWGTDSLVLNYSTFLVRLIPLILRMALSILSLGAGGYLAAKSHGLVLHRADDERKLADSGVYSLIRHPMYLGTLVFFLGFFFAISSLFSLVILILFFVIYDWMATYEENSLVRLLGEEYAAYQKRVPKWFPRLRRLQES